MSALQISEKVIFNFLEPKKADIIKLMGGEMNYKRELSFAIQAVNSNEQLQKASHASIAKCVFNLATTNLSLNPVLKLAYLTPRAGECSLVPSYQGLVKLLKDCDCVQQVYAHCYYEGDEFDYCLGTEVTIAHKPKFSSKKILGVYAVAVLPQVGKIVEYMPAEEVEGIRARSDGYRAFKAGKIKTTPWVTDEQEMFRKTVIRRIFKYVPKSQKFNHIAEAIALDEQEYPATFGQISFIESLLNSCALDSDNRDIILEKLSDCTAEEAEKIIQYLQDNQLNPVKQGPNHSTTEAAEEATK